MLDLYGKPLSKGDRVDHADGTRTGTVAAFRLETVLVKWDSGETYTVSPHALVLIDQKKK